MSSGGHGFAASHGAAATGGDAQPALRGADKKPPPLMDPSRQRDRQRILALFRPYRPRLTVVLAMIVFSAGLSMVSPFLLKAVLDKGIFAPRAHAADRAGGGDDRDRDHHRGAQRLADLPVKRGRPARHARPARGRLPPPAADVAGLLHPDAHRRGAVADRQRHRRPGQRRHDDRHDDRPERHHRDRQPRRRCACWTCGWRRSRWCSCPCSCGSPGGSERCAARSPPSSSGAWPTCRRWWPSRCRCPGSCSARRWAAAATWPTRFTGESKGIADLEVRSRMAGRWVMSTIQMTFAIQPAIIYWLAGQSFIGARSGRHRGGVHDAADPAAVPDPVAARRGADVEASMALFDRIFEYLDLPVDIVEAEDPVELRPDEVLGEVRFENVSFRYERAVELPAPIPLEISAPAGPPGRIPSPLIVRATGRSADSTWTLRDIDIVVPAGTRTAIVGETGSGKTTLGYLVARLYEPQQGRVTIDGVDVREASLASLAATVGVVSQETYLFHATVRENLRFARPEATDEEIEDAARTARIHDSDRLAARGLRHDRRRARLPLLRRREAADGDRPHGAAQPAGAGARRGDQLAGHPDRVRGPGRARARWPKGARRSPSPTVCRRSATPTRSSSSTRDGSSSAAPTRSCSSAAAPTRRWWPAT